MAKKKEFDKIYTEFFGSKKKIKEIVKNIINFRFMDVENYSSSDDYMFTTKPDHIERFNEGPFKFEKRIWIKENGDKIIQVLMVDEYDTEVEEVDLEKQLTNALEVEDYDTAIKLRDIINKKNRKK
jgi:hypothetical protein